MGLGASRETNSPQNIGKDPGGSRVGPGPPPQHFTLAQYREPHSLVPSQSPELQDCSSTVPAASLPSPCFHVVKNIRAYGEGAPTVVQATGAPEPVVHHLCAHVGTLAHEQAVLDLLLGAIIVREGPTAARRSGLRGYAGSGMGGKPGVQLGVQHLPGQCQANAIVSKPGDARAESVISRVVAGKEHPQLMPLGATG